MSTATWTWEALSSAWEKASFEVPSVEEIREHFITDNLNQALGEFVRKMVDGGYQTTILNYAVDIDLHLIRKRVHLRAGATFFTYRTHVTLTVDFTTDKPLAESPLPPIVWIAISAAIIILSAGVYFALQNLSTTSSIVKYILTNPSDEPVTVTVDDQTITIPPGGEFTYTEKEKTAPLGGLTTILIVGIAGLLLITFFGEFLRARRG